MTPRQADRQARRECSLYRQGRGWVLTTYDPTRNVWWTSGELDWWRATAARKTWRDERMRVLLGANA